MLKIVLRPFSRGLRAWSPLAHSSQGLKLLAVFATSSITTGIIGFALPWLTLQLGGSPSLVAFILGAEGLIEITLLFPAGIWADRSQRKFLLMTAACTQTAVATILLGLVLTGSLTILFLVVASMFLTISGCVEMAAGYGAVRFIVDDDDLMAAQASLKVLNQIAYFGGPALGGMLFMFFGEYGLMSVLAAVASLGLLAVSTIRVSLSSSEIETKSIRKQTVDSFHIVSKKGSMRILLTIGGIFNIAVALSLSVFLVFLKVNHFTPGEVALVLTAGIVGSFMAGPLCQMLVRRCGVLKIVLLAGLGEALCIVLVTILLAPIEMALCYGLLMLCNTTWVAALAGERARLAPLEAQSATATSGLVVLLSCWSIGTIMCGILIGITAISTIWVISGIALAGSVLALAFWLHKVNFEPDTAFSS